MKGLAPLVRYGICMAVAVCLGVVAFGTSLIGDLANNATRQLRQACNSLVGSTPLTPQDTRHEATFDDGPRYASITLVGFRCPDDALQDYVGQQLNTIVQKARQEHERTPVPPHVTLPPAPASDRRESAVPIPA